MCIIKIINFLDDEAIIEPMQSDILIYIFFSQSIKVWVLYLLFSNKRVRMFPHYLHLQNNNLLQSN